GLGIVLLALFALWGMTHIHKMNGLKNGLSFVLSISSVLVFAIGGLVEWHYALAMMVASTIGGYAGAPLARRLPKSFVRGLIAAVGFSMSVVFFARLI
ncbi:sulfite exporter TauE/SafE family protein, partial [Yoonia sp.]|nr:sulfite exporter TauE/SafE family protein [Yoonia sp.]